jgi:polar amino acid transport system substrate-binding protein
MKALGVAFTVAAALILAGCGSRPVTTAEGYTLVQEGKLVVLSDLAYPPIDSVPEGGTAQDAVGYEVDLVDAIAEKLGLEVEWEQVKFDTIIPLIKQGGKADIGASAFTITDEREEEVDFSDPYLNSNLGIVMSEADAVDDPTTYLNDSTMRIAVQSGTSGEAWAQENLPNAQIVSLDDIIQAMTGVQAGLYNAAIADLPVVSYMTQESYTDLEVVDEIPTGEQYALVVSQDNPKLTEAIDKAYEELVADGTVKELQLEWFGEEL